MVCAFLVIWGFMEYRFKFEKEGRASRRTKSHPAEGSGRDNRSDQESAVKRHCRRHHRPRALRIAPVCKEPPAAQARGLRDKSKSQERLGLEIGVNQTGTPISHVRRE